MKGARTLGIRLLVFGLVIAALGLLGSHSGLRGHPGLASPTSPVLADPDRFTVELFVDFASLGLAINGFQLTMTSGENGFPAGLYVTPGPDTWGDKLVRVDGPSDVSVVTGGLSSSEAMVFARGAYGDGILITEPRDSRIRRLLADGSLTTFAENVSTLPFGPAVLAYGPGGVLYATDGSSGSSANGSRDILQINADGTRSVFASIPESIFPQCLTTCFTQVYKAVAYASVGAVCTSDGPTLAWQEGGGLISGTFSLDSAGPSMLDTLFAISSDGSTVTKLVDGLSGLELVELGPGGAFGSDLFVATIGSGASADGALFALSPYGTLTPFLTNIDAVDVAFDTAGILGGGMFVSDRTDQAGPGKIWRVVPTAVGGTAELLTDTSHAPAAAGHASGPSTDYAALAGAAAAAALAVAAGGWHARRRWLR